MPVRAMPPGNAARLRIGVDDRVQPGGSGHSLGMRPSDKAGADHSDPGL